MGFVVDSNVVAEEHPLLSDVYTFAEGHGHTDNARVVWTCLSLDGRKMFHCLVVHNSVNMFTYDGGRVGDVWELVRV